MTLNLKAVGESSVANKLKSGRRDEIEINKSMYDKNSNVGENSDSDTDNEITSSFKKEPESVIPNLNPIPKFMMRVNDHKRVKWDLFIMALATWNCIWIPLVIAFEPEATHSIPIIIFDNVIDC